MGPPLEGKGLSADRDAQPIELQQSFWDNWNTEH